MKVLITYKPERITVSLKQETNIFKLNKNLILYLIYRFLIMQTLEIKRNNKKLLYHHERYAYEDNEHTCIYFTLYAYDFACIYRY